MLSLSRLDPLFDAAAEASGEAIINPLTAGGTMTGLNGNTVDALSLEQVRNVLSRYKKEKQ